MTLQSAGGGSVMKVQFPIPTRNDGAMTVQLSDHDYGVLTVVAT